jgi:hypothetical protein
MSLPLMIQGPERKIWGYWTSEARPILAIFSIPRAILKKMDPFEIPAMEGKGIIQI